MSLFRQLDKVRAAQARVAAHRAELATPAAALLARGQRHPALMLGAAGGAGFLLGSLDASPLRVPGLESLLRGGLAEAVAQGVRLFATLGADAADDASA
ncbi:hypothetical protein [Rhodanobacter sp. DHB23]|uniref:hypothetical protein n=1 Tax=Rhodanobacter sp. DHB23 TaxID=2775923 RepID=UPI00178168FD|nr:hypothetical protein [Rhodanobacter sp. DHB23]MBD8874600.1 hypothetical protein [Rhodanobacter sp. DHB23]